MQSLKAQTMYCEINGSVINNPTFKFAYLFDHKLNKVVHEPIIDNYFSFKLPKPETYQYLQLFFEEDSTKNSDYFKDQAKKYRNNGRTIAVENAVLEFEGGVNRVKVKKGKLNEDVEEMYLVMKTNNYNDFIQKHLDSPLSLKIIGALAIVNKVPELTDKYDCKLLFNKLSESVRNSPEGKELFSTL